MRIEVITFVGSELMIGDALIKVYQLKVEMLKSALVADGLGTVIDGLVVD